MPLDAEQQKAHDTLTNLAAEFTGEVGKYQDSFRQAEVIKIFDTRGKPLDLGKLSDQQLKDMFDVGRKASALNEVDSVEFGHRLGNLYLVEKNISSARGPESKKDGPDVPASREYLEEAVGTWMNVLNNAYNPRDLLQAEMTLRDSPGIDLGNKIQTLEEKYEALQKSVQQQSGEHFQDAGIEQTISGLKQQQKLFEGEAHDFKVEGMKQAAKAGVEFAAQQGFDADAVETEVYIASRIDLAVNADISGTNIRGLDLSKSDLSKMRVDAETLSRANGLGSVKGVEPRLLAEAQAIKPHVERLDDLNERMAKLENKGGVLANLRNLRHGGVDGERKHLEKEIEKAQQAMQQSQAGVAAQFPAQENEFEQKATYGIGGELSVRPETAESLAAKKSQASETFKVDSTQALDNRGATFAIGKMGLGNKTTELQKAHQDLRAGPAPDPADQDAVKARRAALNKSDQAVEDSAAKDVNVLGTMGPLYGREAEVGAALGGSMVEDAAAKKAALGADTTTLLTRAVATSTVNKALGMDAVAEEKFAMDGNGQASTLSVAVPGAAILTRPTRENPQESFLKADYKDPAIQKGLFDLEAQDYITGQIDRHTGNIFVDPNNKEVRGIDNDLAFPTVSRDQLLHDDAVAAKAVATKPMFMHSDTADKIEALKPEDLRKALESIETPAGVAGLEPEAIDGAVNRLKELQDHVKDLRKDGRVVDKFNDDTFRIAREAQIKVTPGNDLSKTIGLPPPASYLGAAIADTEKTLAINAEKPEDQRRKVLEKTDVPKPQVDAKFAAYQKGVEDARADVAANPGQLQDAGLAKTITDGQAKLMKLQDQLQTHDQNLTAAAARLNKAKESGNAEVTAGLEEIFDNAQQARQKTLQELKVEQQKVSAALDQAVEPQKPQIAAQARLATNQVQVQQPQNQVNPGEVTVEANANDQKLEASGEIKLEESGEVKLEASNEIPLTQSQIDAIENEFGDLEQGPGEIELDASGELQVEDEKPGIEMNEVSDEERGIEAEGNNQKQDQPAMEAPAPANEAAQGQGQEGPGKKSKFASVRDSIKGLASTAKSAVAQKLEDKGSEQKLSEVSAEKQAEYKGLQKQLGDLKKGGGDAIKAAGVLGPDPKAYKDFKNGSPDGGMTEPEIKAKMDDMKKESPGLKQLDRSKVGQVINSNVRDAAKSVGAKIKG
ncbi:MAG: hypothetical protein V4662_01030 [Verrucomicrobiota bacterium]